METRRFLRAMAWERAKGELRSILETYLADDEEKYTAMKQATERYIEIVEDDGLAE